MKLFNVTKEKLYEVPEIELKQKLEIPKNEKIVYIILTDNGHINIQTKEDLK
ncbi:hypothetical protein [Nitrosopumilus spindle-shaped virus]|uniref:Uncharacterized protein n=1 Tax=Nitrosopumilus spindle-shaped virus TaxID=2508184 RepID=A0A514K330_9VIRU|nr:hypothetical protein [Nitrosopumilus spindle-shaped virus]